MFNAQLQNQIKLEMLAAGNKVQINQTAFIGIILNIIEERIQVVFNNNCTNWYSLSDLTILSLGVNFTDFSTPSRN
jgi:hypothetical protein